MNVTNALARLSSLGVKVTRLPEGDLWLEPASVIPPELLEAVKQQKRAIIAHLARPELADGPPEWHAQHVAQAVQREGVCLFWSELFGEMVAFVRDDSFLPHVPQGVVVYRDAELRHLFGEGKVSPSDGALKIMHAAKKAGGKVTGWEPGERGQHGPG